MRQPNEKGTQKYLALYRIETSKSDIKAAEILLAAKEFRGANNRAYYGIYHAISAVHALDGNAYKRHKDALANFNKNYVKPEIFPRKLGKKIVESEEIRNVLGCYLSGAGPTLMAVIREEDKMGVVRLKEELGSLLNDWEVIKLELDHKGYTCDYE